jgi:hypothetical protein
MEPISPTKLPAVKITKIKDTQDYLCMWPDGVRLRMSGQEVAHGEDLTQSAIALRQRAGL